MIPRPLNNAIGAVEPPVNTTDVLLMMLNKISLAKIVGTHYNGSLST